MKVIFVYGEGAFWNAVFENGDEIGGFIEYEDAVNAEWQPNQIKPKSLPMNIKTPRYKTLS